MTFDYFLLLLWARMLFWLAAIAADPVTFACVMTVWGLFRFFLSMYFHLPLFWYLKILFG